MSAAAAAFWRSYLRQLPAGHPHLAAGVYSVFAFDDTPAVSDKLAALVVAGRKKATASLPIQSEAEGTRLPEAGDLSIVTLGDGTPVAIIETTDVRLVPFGTVEPRSPPRKAKETFHEQGAVCRAMIVLSHVGH